MQSEEAQQKVEECGAKVRVLEASVSALIDKRVALKKECRDGDPVKRAALRTVDLEIVDTETDLEIAQEAEADAKAEHASAVRAEKSVRRSELCAAGSLETLARKLRVAYFHPLIQLQRQMALILHAANVACAEHNVLVAEETDIAAELGDRALLERLTPDVVRVAGQQLIANDVAEGVATALTPLFDDTVYVNGMKAMHPSLGGDSRLFNRAEALLSYVKGQ